MKPRCGRSRPRAGRMKPGSRWFLRLQARFQVQPPRSIKRAVWPRMRSRMRFSHPLFDSESTLEQAERFWRHCMKRWIPVGTAGAWMALSAILGCAKDNGNSTYSKVTSIFFCFFGAHVDGQLKGAVQARRISERLSENLRQLRVLVATIPGLFGETAPAFCIVCRCNFRNFLFRRVSMLVRREFRETFRNK